MDTAEYNITFFHDVRSKKVKWLWYPYIPYGKITLIQGDPGDGKTSFILNLIARMSNGDTLPFSKAHIHGVAIYQNAEDDIADTIKPRLERQHANCQNICFIDQTSPLLIENNSIEKAISETGAKLLVLDPLQSFMGEHIDMNRANSVRPLMQHLKKIAATTGCAIVLVGHLNKNISNKASYRGLGSIDIIAAARSVLLIGKDEENPNMRYLVHQKCNLAPLGSSLEFCLNGGELSWIGTSSITAADLTGHTPTKKQSKQNEAAELILSALSDGPVPAHILFELAEEQGLSRRTLNLAKARLPVCSIKTAQGWVWNIKNGRATNEERY